MAYRGEDLDLRTPQTWSLPPGEPAASADPYLNGGRRTQSFGRAAAPILVDDTVLACCNHAFDVAVAHRASEVRIEHLLHAMTRIDGASSVLDSRGIRVAGLRRESATIIASEIPIGLGAGQGRPRRSDDLENVLRAASAIAYRRNGPANIDDILDALLEMPAEVPGIALLARHGGRIARDRLRPRDRDISRDREPLPPAPPLPPLTRASPPYGTELRTADLSRPLRADLAGTPTDGIQNARLDQLENVVRTLTGELVGERSALSGALQDLQRNMKSERDDMSRFRGGLHERLESLEQAVAGSGTGDSAGQLHDRLKSLEYTILNTRKDDGDAGMLLDRLAAVERGLEQRLNELARPWGVLSDRLQALEQTVLDTRQAKGSDVAGLERAIRDTSVEGSRGMAALADRVKMLERSLDGVSGKGFDLSPIANRLDIIEEAVLSHDGAQTLDKLTERIGALEEALTAQRTLLSQGQQGNQALTSDIKALASALAAQAANSERTHSFVSDRMQMLASGLERQRGELVGPLNERLASIDGKIQSAFGPLADRMNQIAVTLDNRTQAALAPIAERMGSLSTAIDSRGSESQRLITALNERIAALEAKLAESAQKTADAQAAHAAELRDVHDALIKLNTNQHTLAGSIDQWRLDGVGDISVIAKQLEGLQGAAARPVAMIEQLTANVDTLNRATVERYHRRNRFWYWLFGTDDWLTASWPSQVASVEAERAALRGSVPSVAPSQSKGTPGRAA